MIAVGRPETAIVDAMDESSVATHAENMAASAGSIDIAFNAISFKVVQNIPLVEMALEDFVAPVRRSCSHAFHYLDHRGAAYDCSRFRRDHFAFGYGLAGVAS